jgi:hypothetical protein
MTLNDFCAEDGMLDTRKEFRGFIVDDAHFPLVQYPVVAFAYLASIYLLEKSK